MPKEIKFNAEAYSVREKYGKLLAELQTAWQPTYKAIASDLQFASGGEGMWDKGVLSARQAKSRPIVTIPLLHPYVERLVSPVRVHPPGMAVRTEDPKIEMAVNGLLRGIERASTATDAYANALKGAVTAGIGWLYLSVDDEAGQQVLRIKSPTDPTCIMIDPLCQCLDGRDARYACYRGYISKDYAQKTWGQEATERPWNDEAGVSTLLFSIPENSVMDCIWYEVEEKGMRITRTVGAKVVYNQLFEDVKYLPIVPVIGEVLFGMGGRKFGGIIRRGRDINSAINVTASNVMELVALAPKTPFIGANEAFKGNESDWAQVNTEPLAYIGYNHKDKDGQPIMRPERMDNSPQTQALQSVAEWMQGLLSRATGISDSMLGGLETAQESGKSLIARMEAAEGASGQYIDHLMTSITQLARVLIQMLPLVYNTDRNIVLIDGNGRSTRVKANVSQKLTPEIIEMLDVDVESGPHMELKRKAAAESLSQIISTAGEKGFALLDLWADTQDLPNAVEVKDRLKKILPPELTATDEEMGDVDPRAIEVLKEAEAAIAQKDETIQYLEGALAQLQAQVSSQQAIYEVELRKAEINAQVQLEKTRLEIESKREIELLKQGSEDNRLAAKLTSDTRKQLQDIEAEMALKNQEVLNKADERVLDFEYSPAARVPEYVLDDITEAKNNKDE